MTLDNRRRLAAAALAGSCLSAAAFAVGVIAVGRGIEPAAAATAGTAQVIEPSDGISGGGPLTGGDSLTPFSLDLPTDAACTGDSATDNYFVFSYMVASTVDPGTLTFDGVAGPLPSAYGEPLASFRQPLYDLVTAAGYVGASTAAADVVGGPGPVINIPAFSFQAYDPPEPAAGEPEDVFLPPGDYVIGIACWGPTDDPVVDKFWSAAITVVADSVDTGPVGVTWTVQDPATPTSVVLAADPAGPAAAGDEVGLTATVTPSDAVGSVTFTDGGTSLGGAVTVVGGVATLATSALTVGDHPLVAAFAPTDGSGFAAATSAELVYTVTESGSTTTTSSSVTTTTAAGGTTSTTATAGAPGATTTTAPAGGTGGAGGPTTGVGVNVLASTGGSLSLVLWGSLMLVLGRMAVLLGRPPRVRPAG